VITRRNFALSVIAALVASSRPSLAQQKKRIWRIGFLGAETAAAYATRVEAMHTGLRELGYIDGKNLRFEYRWADGKYDRLPQLAAQLVGLSVDVIITHGAPGTSAAKNATSTIPIVIASIADAEAVGAISSLARPGANVTGSTLYVPEITAKRIELMKEALPQTRTIGLPVYAANPANTPILEAAEGAARTLNLKLHQFSVRGANDLEEPFAAMSKARIDAMVVSDLTVFSAHIATVASLAAKYRLPGVGSAAFAQAGGMIGYGGSMQRLWRRSAYFVDKILKGAKPSDLPVERVTQLETVVNLKAAKALGVAIPQSILVRADKVIE
jgi:putative tryptophan/tyrosine transport system substrate-binding protein